MSPRRLGISTTYKTQVACKERLGIVIGQLKDRRVFGSFQNLARSSIAIPMRRIRLQSLPRTPFDGNKRSGLLEGHCHCKAITHDPCLSDDVATGSLLPPSSQCPIQLDQAAEFVTSCTCE